MLKKTRGIYEAIMKEYRANQRQLKNNIEQKQKSLNVFTDAIKVYKAKKKELQTAAITKANETANK